MKANVLSPQFERRRATILLSADHILISTGDSSMPARGSAAQALVSVVIPAYNAASYIVATLNSVLAQTYTNYEIIVVNDGSPDTAALNAALQPYMSKIRYIEQPNMGPSSARNTGIRAARGKYVAFLDSDDLWFPHHLARQVEHLENDATLGLIYANGVQMEQEDPIGVSFDTTPQSLPVTFDTLLREQATVGTSSTVVSRQALLNVGLFDEQFRRCEDYDLWLRLAHAGVGMTFTREIHIGHRLANGLAANGDLMKQAMIQVYQKAVSTQKLTNEQFNFIQKKITRVSTAMHFERAKQALLENDFARARNSVAEARAIAPNWKLNVLHAGLRTAPRLLQAIYRFNLLAVERRKRYQRQRALHAVEKSRRTLQEMVQTTVAR